MVAWASRLEGSNPLVLGAPYALSNYGYREGIAEPVFDYIAYRNRNVFEAGTDAYDNIWDMIHYAYGDTYDEEYAA